MPSARAAARFGSVKLSSVIPPMLPRRSGVERSPRKEGAIRIPDSGAASEASGVEPVEQLVFWEGRQSERGEKTVHAFAEPAPGPAAAERSRHRQQPVPRIRPQFDAGRGGCGGGFGSGQHDGELRPGSDGHKYFPLRVFGASGD